MDIQLLEDIGLTNAQARSYKALVASGHANAPTIAAEIRESRSNTYKILDKLCELGLATKDQTGNRVVYLPTSPIKLESLVRDQAAAAERRERKLKASMPELLSFFSAHSEQPGVSYYQGFEGLYKIFHDQIKAKQPVYFIRGHHAEAQLGWAEAHRLRNLFPMNGIKRHAIVQDILPPNITDADKMPIAESDKLMLLHRTWVGTEDYDEPVEWAAYGDKLAIISFGKEVTGTIIHSPQIARAFRKIYALLDSTIRLRDDYHEMPKQAKFTRIPMSIQVAKALNKKRP